MKKSELEREIKRLTRSVGWYSSAYYRLKEAEALSQDRIESLEEEVDRYEREFDKARLKQTREQEAARKSHKARQAELLKKQLKVQQAQSGPPPRIEAGDDIEDRLARCQETNAKLRNHISKLETELRVYKSEGPPA